MPTFEHGDIIKKLLENNGIYPGDPQCLAIHSYTHSITGYKLYHVAYSAADMVALWSSPFVKSPLLLWEAKSGLTPAGKVELEEVT
jgi:hypothetical protein